MPGKVLLISVNRCQNPDPVFPLGLTYLNAGLRAAGHSTEWLDLLHDADRFDELLRASQASFVGISIRNIDDVLIRRQELFVRDLAELVGRVRSILPVPVILGGSGFSIFPKELLALSGADFGICGAGESAFPSLLAALEKGSVHREIPGLVFRQGGEIVTNPPSTEPPRVEIAPQDRPAHVVARYLESGGMLNLQTQRGCAFPCSYCTYPLIEGKRHQSRPPEAVAEELEQLRSLGAKYVFFTDSIFNSAKQHVASVCEAILQRGVKVDWGCFLRPQGLTPELLALMARAGLAHVEFGSDSFSDTVLSAYRKGFCFEDILYSSELARAANLPFCHFLIAGGPKETHATLAESFHNSHRLRDPVILAVIGMRIYPGTFLHEQAIREGVVERSASLLSPAYYLAPGLTEESVFAQLQGFARSTPTWVVGDHGPRYAEFVSRLRKRGVAGPLWSYFAAMQRLWPQGPAVGTST